MAGVSASQPDVEARVLTLYADEAERWTNAMKENDYVVSVYEKGEVTKQIKAGPSIVTKDPAKCAPGCDIIALVVPAFAHTQYIEALKPYIKPGTIIAGLPGQTGFEFSVLGLLGDLARECTVLNFESLPWVSRLKTFGQEGEILSQKLALNGSSNMGKVISPERANAMLQKTMGQYPVLNLQGHMLGTSLMNVNAYIHPSILYGQWHDWDGKPVDENPLFYQGLSEESAAILSGVSDEVMATTKEIIKQKPEMDLSNVCHIYDYYMRVFGEDVADKTNLYTVLRSNKAYIGLRHPCKQTPEGKFYPDYEHRYITEDIPFGLVALRGISEIVGVQTPVFDKLIQWAEKVSGKEYLVDGKIKGKDVADSRAPQRYGINTVEGLLSF